MSWNAVLDTDVAHYTVYRSNAPDAGDIPLATSPTSNYLNDSVPVGATYYYRVASVDTTGNTSGKSAQASARPRHGTIAAPTLNSTAFEVDSKGTTSTAGTPYNAYWDDTCNVSEEEDDVIQVDLTWTASGSAGVSGYRVYRSMRGTESYSRVADLGNVLAHDDVEPPGADFDYYVVAKKTIANVIEESPASGVLRAEDLFPASTVVRNLTAYDGRIRYTTRNKESRSAQIYWSRVPERRLKGYHVYRRCEGNTDTQVPTDHCEREANWPSTNDISCASAWVRITDAPLDSSTKTFEDGTVGGLQGCFVYAIRAVADDPNLATFYEGPMKKALSFDVPRGSTQEESHCHWDPSTSKTNQPSGKSAIDLVNEVQRGTLSPTGSPAPPTNVQVVWDCLQCNKLPLTYPSLETRGAQITWTANQEKDLAGYYIEVAGSYPNGPWKRVSPNLIAWWETKYVLLGLGHWNRLRTTRYGHTECMHFRVIAVDEYGVESAPAYPAGYPLAGCSVSTPTTPQNLRVTEQLNSGGRYGSCQVHLEWNASPGATEYYVYRMVIEYGHIFYMTRVVTTNGVLYDGDASADCAYCDATCTGDAGARCHPQHLSAYYVTARSSSGGESPRSNTIFWNCDFYGFGQGGYVRNESPAKASEELLAASGEELDFCPLVAAFDPASSRDGLGAVEESHPNGGIPLVLAPMLKLGSVTNPPWIVQDLHTDHLGSVRLITTDDGRLLRWHEYLPFGEEDMIPQSYNTHQFTGHERDQATGLDYMLARYYMNGASRFLTVDPLLHAFKSSLEPQRWNRYTYVLNTPINAIDPSGKDTYLVNRRLGGDEARSRSNPVTHTFVATTDDKGKVEHTYSWGNNGKNGKWVKDAPEDRKAAQEALDKGKAEKKGGEKLDAAVDKTFEVKKEEPAHLNLVVGGNCKTEGNDLLVDAEDSIETEEEKEKEAERETQDQEIANMARSSIK